MVPSLSSRTVLCLLFAIPVFAQGPPLFQSATGNQFFSVSFGIIPESGDTSCTSTVANPYPNPKFNVTYYQNDTNCTIGTSLSTSMPFSALATPLGLPLTDSGTGVSTGARNNVTATVTVSSFSDPSMNFIPVAGDQSFYYQENLPAGVSPGSPLSLQFQIQGSTGSYGCLQVFIKLVSDDPTQEVDVIPDLGINCRDAQQVSLPVTTPPLTIGPSGTYSIYIQAIAQQNGVGTSSVHVFGCGADAIDTPPSGSFQIADWSGSYQITSNQGLELDDVMLQNRYMAASMKLPYIQLQTAEISSTACTLQPNSDDDSCRSRLLAFDPNKDGALEATYQLDRIPATSGSCMMVTQRYEFYPIFNSFSQLALPPIFGGPGCGETSGLVTCARFNPMVTYEFIPQDPAKDTLTRIDIAQRMQFQDDQISPNTASMFTDHNLPYPLPVVDAMFGDPMSENWAQAIENGEQGAVDNYHQTFNPGGVSEPGLDLHPNRFNPGGPGCPECIHIHWRWGTYFGPVFGLGSPLVPGNALVSSYARVEKPPSNQSVIVAAVNPATDPGSVDIASAVDPGASLYGVAPAFWYVGRGFQRVDTFFGHGGFFAPSSVGTIQGILMKFEGINNNHATGFFTQVLQLQNTTSQPITGPISVALDNLSSNAGLANADGFTLNTTPFGSPYVYVGFPGGEPQLYPGETATLLLQFYDSTNGGITYSPRVLSAGVP